MLKSLISKHESYHNDIKTCLGEMIAGLDGNETFQYASVKGYDRAMIKLKEKIAEDPENKFPM